MQNSAMSMAPPETQAQPRRNTNLDALRGIAILMVLGRHAGEAIERAHASNLFTSGWERIGWAGVDLFFVLSGFLISGLLFADYQQRGQIGLVRFYIRRGFKIWPSLYTLIAVGLLASALGFGHHFTARQICSELFFLQDYIPGIWGITWSIAVEEHFYLVLPLLLLFLIHRNPRQPFAVLPQIFFAIAVIALACRFAVGWKQDGIINPWTCLFPTHLRMDGLMFGVLICYFKRFRPSIFQWFVRWWGGWAVIAVALILLSIFPQDGRQMHTWGFTVIYLGAGFLVAKAVAHEGPHPIRVISGLLASIGFYSYSIYLWHVFFFQVLEHFHIKSPIANYWCFIIGSILFGIAASKVIEIPVLHIRDRMFPSLSKPPALTAPAETPAPTVAAG
jgi:peptidoglycan/LPS O-acetylase OafA/YrhL